jgi:LPS sulfotransferase NodH
MKPKISYLICTTPRSGSWLLSDALQMTGLAGRPREYFSPALESEWLKRCQASTPSSYADFVVMVKENGTSPNGVFGCKLHWYHFQHLVAKLREFDDTGASTEAELVARAFPELRYIWLFRRDKVRQAVSYYRASRAGQRWEIQSSANGHRPDVKDVPFDYAGIDRLRDTLLLHESNWRQFFEASQITPLKVAYEDLARDYRTAILLLLNAIGVPVPPNLEIFRRRLKRQADENLECWVKRYRELKFGPKPVGGRTWHQQYAGSPCSGQSRTAAPATSDNAEVRGHKMTTTRFPEAFNGDPYIEAEIRRLVGSASIKTIIETGTYRGHTTRAFSNMAVEVVTIEIDRNFWDLGKHLDLLGNVRRIQGDSGKVLETVLPQLHGPFLFYLDAHWGMHSPLLEELDAIARSGLKPIIAIHDFQNPTQPSLGFDEWDIGPYRFEIIASKIVAIYGENGWRHWFNSEALGAKRGIIYIERVEGIVNNAYPATKDLRSPEHKRRRSSAYTSSCDSIDPQFEA